MNNKVIAVIGNGFVGGTLTTVMSCRMHVLVYDKAGYGAKAPGGEWPMLNGGQAQSTSDLVRAAECRPNFTGIFFVCVPTPMKKNGACDTSIVESVLQELADAPAQEGQHQPRRIAVVKSTVPPGSIAAWNERFKSTCLRIVFNPEFLTEARALKDFEEQDRIVLGGPPDCVREVATVFRYAFMSVPIVKTTSTNAEMVKYLANCFLAVKVSFANEMLQICDAVGADYDDVVDIAKRDKRLGDSHWAVPGPDGHFGYGGSCFIKDTNALMRVAGDAGVIPHVLDGAWQKNLEVRPERDWELLKGRAVV